MPILLGSAGVAGVGAIGAVTIAGPVGVAPVLLFATAGALSVAALAILGQRLGREQARLHRSVKHLGKLIEAESLQLDGINAQIRANETAHASLTSTVEEVNASVTALHTSTEHTVNSAKSTIKTLERISNRLAPGKSGIEETTRKLVARDASALLALHTLVELRAEPLATTSFSATPETLLALIALVETVPEGGVIVEAGSGLSTVWLALAVAQSGRSIPIIALEHDANYAQATRDAVARQGVETAVDVRFAPLASITLDGQHTQWYDREGWADINRIDILFIDGPPASTGPQSRCPALPALRHLLADRAAVILDDTDRNDERACMERWLAETDEVGSLAVERELDRATLMRYRHAKVA